MVPADARVVVDQGLHTNAVVVRSTSASEVVRHSVEELGSAYGANALAPASSVVGAIIASGNLENTLLRLQHFQTLHGLHTPVKVVTVGDPAAPGFRSSADSKTNESEWDMDTQLLVGSAGGLKQLIIYNIPDLSWKSMADGLARAADDNLARVVSMSIYASETEVNDTIFQAIDASVSKAVKQGQNILICSGDDGIYQPLSARARAPYYDSLQGHQDQRQVAFPASDPYAIAVGATELQTKTGSAGTYAAERVWNAGVGRQISQGGLSRGADAPQWQKTAIAAQVSSDAARCRTSFQRGFFQQRGDPVDRCARPGVSWIRLGHQRCHADLRRLCRPAAAIASESGLHRPADLSLRKSAR